MADVTPLKVENGRIKRFISSDKIPAENLPPGASGGDMLAANNLSDVANVATARTNLGKDSTGGLAGLTLFKINFKNVANTFISFFTNLNTAARTYTFQDRDGTIADDTDLAGKANSLGADDNYVTDAEKVKLSNLSGTNTGDQDLSGKQNTLVSGTNIKTINGSSVLGSGNLSVSATITETEIDVGTTPVAEAYTAAPTKGTLVGTIASWRALWQATTAAAAGVVDYFVFNFGDMRETRGVVLRGIAQELALVFPVVLASAGTLAIDIEWTEE